MILSGSVIGSNRWIKRLNRSHFAVDKENELSGPLPCAQLRSADDAVYGLFIEIPVMHRQKGIYSLQWLLVTRQRGCLSRYSGYFTCHSGYSSRYSGYQHLLSPYATRPWR